MSTNNGKETYRITDRESYKNVFHLYYKSLSLFAVRFIPERDVLEDLVQETFIALWENRNQLRSSNAIKSYLYSTLRNKCLNYLRHLDTVNRYAENYEMLENTTDFSKSIIKEETLRLFYKAIDSLNENTRKVIYLTLEGYKREEIAEKLDITIDTVKYHKKSAMHKLKHLLGEHFYLLMLL